MYYILGWPDLILSFVSSFPFLYASSTAAVDTSFRHAAQVVRVDSQSWVKQASARSLAADYFNAATHSIGKTRDYSESCMLNIIIGTLHTW